MKSRWLVILPAVFFAFFPQSANAETQPGLNAVGYTISDIPPTQSDYLYPTCGTELENNINRNFDGEPFAGCGWDWFMVHYTGFITIPENTSIEFMVAADDGGTVNIGGYSMGTWDLKGCSWSEVVSPELPGGVYGLDGWFFEAGGSTCYMLAWRIDNGDWEIVPEWAFTTTFTPQTTTTTSTVPSETVPVTDPPTTSTVQETSTTTTTLEPEPSTTTTEESTTTSTTSTTTTSTVPQTTPTEAPWVPPPTVDTLPPTTLATTTTAAPEPSTTIAPETTAPQVSTSVSLAPPTAPPKTPVTLPSPQPTASTMPPDASGSSVSDATPETVPDTPETLLEALNASPEPTPSQAAQLATNPQVLAAASTEQAAAIFEALNVNDLTDQQIEALITAVQDAPTEIRATFEDTINIFGDGFSNYVPLGSVVSVGVRRTLIAVTAGITLAAAGSRIRR